MVCGVDSSGLLDDNIPEEAVQRQQSPQDIEGSHGLEIMKKTRLVVTSL